MHNKINLLRPGTVFAAVVHHGSFRQAAIDLGMSAPLVSQLVSELEENLGVQLLYRTTRKLTLTDAGKRFFNHMSGAIEAFETGLADVAKGKDGLTGRLRVTAPTVISTPLFARFLVSFRQANPGLQLEIDLSDERRDAIDENYDLALRIGMSVAHSKGARKIFDTTIIACASPFHLAPLSDPIGLNNIDCISPPGLSGGLNMTHNLDKKSVFVTPRSIMPVNGDTLTRALIAEGDSFGVFPDFVVREAIQAGQLFDITPGWNAGKAAFYAIPTTRNVRLSIATGFVDDLVAFLRA